MSTGCNIYEGRKIFKAILAPAATSISCSDGNCAVSVWGTESRMPHSFSGISCEGVSPEARDVGERFSERICSYFCVI
jgi:hypothetical protein